MNRAIIGVGSNIAPADNIPRALALLKQHHHVLGKSSLVTTSPIGFANQDDFINGAIAVETTCEQQQFTTYLKTVEDKLGRVRTVNKFGPRPIDLDIVVWNGTIIDNDYFSRDFLRNAVEELRLFF